MPDWGEIFTDPKMQRLPPSAEVMALLPELQARGVRLVLDAGCGAGRHLLPLAAAGFKVLGVDREWGVLQKLGLRLRELPGAAWLARGDLKSLPLPEGLIDFALSVNVINHGYASDLAAYCRELDRLLRPGGLLFIMASSREAGEVVRLPETVELEPGTLVKIATPDGELVHHFPTPESLAAHFPRYTVLSLKTVPTPIPFMGGKVLPQLVFLGEKAR
jgi:SAM-dependent methyltransferase